MGRREYLRAIYDRYQRSSPAKKGVETLQHVLGHSTVKLTERYGRLRPWAVAAEARRIGNNAGETGTVGGTVARATR